MTSKLESMITHVNEKHDGLLTDEQNDFSVSGGKHEQAEEEEKAEDKEEDKSNSNQNQGHKKI